MDATVAYDELISSGRALLAEIRERETAKHERKERERLEAEAARTAAFWEGVREALPPALVPYIVQDDGPIGENQYNGVIRLEAPGLAPILVKFSMDKTHPWGVAADMPYIVPSINHSAGDYDSELEIRLPDYDFRYPDRFDHLNIALALAEERHAELQEALERVEFRRQEYRKWEAERKALEEKGRAQFVPFIVFLVRYSSGVVDGEEHFMESYSPNSEPDEEGWWHLFRDGKIRRTQLSNVLAVEEVHYDDPDKLPWNLCRYETLKSDIYPEIEVRYKVGPNWALW
jgi:hypothetical protein